MIDKNRQTHSRIPVRFVDEDSKASEQEDGGDDGGHTPDELGRASIYEDETEMKRRIERGREETNEGGREQADERDTAGGPDPSDMTESREDTDTKPRSAGGDGASDPAREPGDGRGAPRKVGAATGPELAELLATRAELRRVQAELEKATEERQELRDRVARRQADFENYRKRMERERGETYNRVVAEVVSHLLPVVDNLRRALDAEAFVEASESEEFRHFLHGVELIGKQLNGVLENLGVEVVATVGQPFDPHVHEAIATEDSDEFEPDIVTEEIRRGYRLGDKLLRPAMVKVAK